MFIKRIPIIIDCDPGIDDAFALAYASLSDAFDVLAIVSVAGNVALEDTTLNADFLMHNFNINCPLYQGAYKPLIGDPIIAKYAHGSNGLGGYLFEDNFKSSLISGNSSDLVFEQLKNSSEKVVIAAIGPLTNIAKLILAYPEAKQYIEEIVIMGGAIKRGNYTARAEFNIAADPLAAKILFNSGINIKVLPLDTSESVHFYPEFFMKFKETNQISHLLYKIVESKGLFEYPFNPLYLHDLLTLISIAHPEFFSLIHCNINVETEGNLTKGETIFDLRETSRKLLPNGYYISFKDSDVLIQHCLEVLTHVH